MFNWYISIDYLIMALIFVSSSSQFWIQTHCTHVVSVWVIDKDSDWLLKIIWINWSVSSILILKFKILFLRALNLYMFIET
jgi:hypothetical protein